MRKRLGFVEVLSGMVSISDSTLPFDAYVTTRAPAVRLHVDIDVDVEGGGIERLACASTAGQRGDLVGRVGCFLGQIVICDRPLGERTFGDPRSELRSEYNRAIDRAEAAFPFDVRGVWFLAVRPIEGSGEYPVYRLVDATGQPVGFEVDFVQAEQDDSTVPHGD